MRYKITRYQPDAADLIDPVNVTLSDHEVAAFVLGAVATRLTVGLTIGMDDMTAERAATRIIADADVPLDRRIVGMGNVAQRRLDLSYPNRHRLNIAQQPDRYSVELTLVMVNV